MAKIIFNWNDEPLKYLGSTDSYVCNISNIKVISEVTATEKHRIKNKFSKSRVTVTESGNEQRTNEPTHLPTHRNKRRRRDGAHWHFEGRHVNGHALGPRCKTCATKAHSPTNHIYLLRGPYILTTAHLNKWWSAAHYAAAPESAVT